MTEPQEPGSLPGVSPVRAALKGRCPRCGEGRLFAGYLGIRPACETCGLDFGFTDAGDGPAVFIILLVGFLIVGLALVVEVVWSPPYWLHALIWAPLIIGLSLGLLRPLKGLFIGIQYRQKAREGRLFSE